MNILVVDDDPDVQEFLELFLKGEGYAIDIVNSGKDALSMLEGKKYDVVLLDLKMPFLNGVETLGHIKQSNYDVKVIVITGEKECEKEKAVKKIGVFSIVHKPFKLVEIRKILKMACEKTP